MRRGFLRKAYSRIDKPLEVQAEHPVSNPIVHHNAINPTIPSPIIPPELSDRIIDHLHDDPRTLNSCSRVCHNWVPRSRFHYFRTVELTSSNGTRFWTLLTKNTGIGLLVRVLGILTYDRDDEDPKPLMRALPFIAPLLPKVEKLTLRGYGSYTAAPFRNFATVRELRISGCEIPAFDDFIALICYLPKLEILSCTEALIGLTSIVKKPPPELPRPKIKRLEFIASRIDPTEFTQWLIEEKINETVEELSLRPLHVLALHPVGNFVSTIGANLKELDIALINTAILSTGIFADLLGAQFSLSSCTNLRKLVLCSTKGFIYRSGSETESFSWGASFLRQVPSPTIEEIVLWVSDGDMEFLRSTEWDSAMELLSSKQFSALKDLLVRVWGSEKTVEAMKEVMRRGLGKLEEKGVLRFEIHRASPAAPVE